jgi:hypothetical protein
MRKSLWIVPVLLIAAIGAPNAIADTLTSYTITFTGTGILPTSGSFTYDSTVPNFTNFVVVWSSVPIDLTASANAPAIGTPLNSCFTSSSGASATFSLLTNCATDPNAGWFALNTTGTPEFVFEDCTVPATECPNSELTDISAIIPGVYIPLFSAGGYGGFTVSAVPEPGTLSLTLLGILLLVVVMRKRARTLPQVA